MDLPDVSGKLRTLKRLVSFGGFETDERNRRPSQDLNMEIPGFNGKLKHKKNFVLFKIHDIEMNFPNLLVDDRKNQIIVLKIQIQKAQNDSELARYYQCWRNLALEMDKEAEEKKMADELRKKEIVSKVTRFYEQHPNLTAEEKLHLLKLEKEITDAHDSTEQNENYQEWLEFTNELYRKETDCLVAQNKKLEEDKRLLEVLVDLHTIGKA